MKIFVVMGKGNRMHLVRKEMWNEDFNDYVIKSWELSLTNLEMSVLIKALRVVAKYEEAHESDRIVAQKMLDDFEDSWGK